MRRLTLFQLFSPPAGALLAVSIRYELWLVVLGVTALVVVLARRHLLDRHRWLPALLAARALATVRPEPSQDGVETGAPELAVLAKGRMPVLDRALQLAHREANERRWARSVGRITVAQQLLERGGVPGVAPTRGPSAALVAICSLAASASLLGAVITSSGWWLIPLIGTYAAAMVAWTDWREERHWQPALIAAAADQPSPAPRKPDDGRAAAALGVVARGQIASLRQAALLVEACDASTDEKRGASQLLHMATALLEASGVAPAARRRMATGWAATVMITGATWFITG